jgi:cytochrome b6-f complex iron-sulfur subunit
MDENNEELDAKPKPGGKVSGASKENEVEMHENDVTKVKTSCSKEEPCPSCPNFDQAEAHNTSDSGDEIIGRAKFIRAGFTGAAICWGSMTMIPVLLYLNPPPGEGDEKSKVTSLEACKVSELPKGTGRNFRFGSFPALLIHNEDGELHAFKAICTHLGCTVQFRDDKQCIYCACHGGQYDAHTGKNIAGPPPKPLTPLRVEVVEGKIIVSRV